MIRHRTDLVAKARAAAAELPTWADLSNFLFNPDNGLLTSEFPARKQRVAFQKTDEYRTIMALLGKAMEDHKLLEGATPQKSGKFVVRLPKTLHATLEYEAAEEGISLNQLVVYKLSAQIKPSSIRTERRRHTAAK